MKITKRQLRRLIKEEALNEFFGGKKKKEKIAKATQELQKAALDYINDFSSSKVGPFLKKGDPRGPYNVKGWEDPEGEYYSQVIQQDLTDNDLAHVPRMDDEQHEEMKKHHEVLENIKETWESATGKQADNDNSPFDVRYVAKALAIPGLYLDSNGDEVNEDKNMKITKRQLKRIIKEEKSKFLNEQYVSQSVLENLNDAMQAVYNEVARNSSMDDEDPEVIASGIVNDEVQGWMDSLGMLDEQGDY
jgi:histone H3/H4